MTGSVEYLALDDLLGLAVSLLGDPPPVQDLGLLAAAEARPQASAFGDDAYTDLCSKAAALLHSVVKHRPLVDGDKRLGWLSCAVFLDLNGIDPTAATNDQVYDLVIEVASTPIDVDAIATALQGMLDVG